MSIGSVYQCRRMQTTLTCSTGSGTPSSVNTSVISAGRPHVGQSTSAPGASSSSCGLWLLIIAVPPWCHVFNEDYGGRVIPVRGGMNALRKEVAMSTNLSYEVFVNDPPPQDGVLPNGEPKRFSPMASTLIYGGEDAVLTDPGMTADQARVIGDWVASRGRNLTDIFVTHGHGDHWFAAGLLAERFGARVVASAGSIAQMHVSIAARPLLWDKVYPGIPPSPVTAVTVPGNRFTLEGHDLVIVEVGHADTDDNTVLHVPDLGLVVAGDVIYK